MLSKGITVVFVVLLVASLTGSYTTYSRSLRGHAAMVEYDVTFHDIALGENDDEYVVTLEVANRGSDRGEIQSLRVLLRHEDRLIAVQRYTYEDFILESGDSREVDLDMYSNLRPSKLPGPESIATDDWSVRVQMKVDIPVRFDNVTIHRQRGLSR